MKYWKWNIFYIPKMTSMFLINRSCKNAIWSVRKEFCLFRKKSILGFLKYKIQMCSSVSFALHLDSNILSLTRGAKVTGFCFSYFPTCIYMFIIRESVVKTFNCIFNFSYTFWYNWKCFLVLFMTCRNLRSTAKLRLFLVVVSFHPCCFSVMKLRFSKYWRSCLFFKSIIASMTLMAFHIKSSHS